MGKWVFGAVATWVVGLLVSACSSPVAPTSKPTFTLQSTTPPVGGTVSIGPGLSDPGGTWLNQVSVSGTVANLPAGLYDVSVGLLTGTTECYRGYPSVNLNPQVIFPVRVSASSPNFTVNVFSAQMAGMNSTSNSGTCGLPAVFSPLPAGFVRSPYTVDRLNFVLSDCHPTDSSGPCTSAPQVVATQDVSGGWRFTFF